MRVEPHENGNWFRICQLAPNNRSHLISIVRWLLVVPAGVAGWYLVFFLSLFLFSLVDQACPPTPQKNSACMFGPDLTMQEVVIIIGASVSAIPVVLFSALTAPCHKKVICWVAYSAGLIVAYWFYSNNPPFLPHFLGAATCGLLAAVLFHRREDRRKLDSIKA